MVRTVIRAALWNGAERRLRAPWRLLAAGIALVVGLNAALAGMSLVAFVLGAGSALFAGVVGYVLLTLVSAPVVVGVLWGVARYVDRRRFADYGLRIDERWLGDLGFGLFLGAALQTAVFLVGLGAGWVRVTGLFVADGSFPLLMAALLVLFLAVGLYEELLARGWLLTNAAEGLRVAGESIAVGVAVLLSSAAFGILHLGNPGGSPLSAVAIALAGVFLALGYVLTGELGVPVGVHVTWNFFQGPVFGFGVSGLSMPASIVATEPVGPAIVTGGEFGPEAGLLGMGAVLLGTATTCWWARRREGALAIHERVTVPDLLDRGRGSGTDAD